MGRSVHAGTLAGLTRFLGDPRIPVDNKRRARLWTRRSPGGDHRSRSSVDAGAVGLTLARALHTRVAAHGTDYNRSLMRAASPLVLGVFSLAMLARADAQVVRRPQPPLPSGTATLTGIVLTEAGLPVSGTHVTLTAPAFQAKETETDEEGRFTFTNLPENPLELRASAPAFLEAVYGEKRPGSPGTPIRLRAGQRLNVVIRLFRGSSITGSVADDDGQPVAAIKVWATRLMPLSDGEMLQLPTQSAETDERGHYRITGLPPGLYIVFGYRLVHRERARHAEPHASRVVLEGEL